MDYNTLLDLATDLGYELAMSGAETFRVEESIGRVLSAYGVESEVFAIPNYLIVTVMTQDGQPITRMRRIGYHGNDLDAVEKYSGLSRAFCRRKPDPAEGLKWFSLVKERIAVYPKWAQYLGYFIGSAGYGLFFGGNWQDAFCAGICGMLVGSTGSFLEKRKANPFFRTIASSFFMALLAYAMGALGIAPNPDAVNIGALMILVPGLLFTNAMRDIIYGDTNSGINRIVQVLLIAVGLAVGSASAWQIANTLWGTPVSAAAISYSIPAQCLFAFIGCLGFTILFNIHFPGGLLCMLGGALSWAVYCLSLEFGFGELGGYFWSSLFASVYSECMARIRKCPAISYLVVSIFPMIPGAGVYYTMTYAVQGQMERFASRGMYTAAIAGIMAVGILLGSSGFRMYSDWKQHKTAVTK
ncbi:MAG: threonine/serine exporter family protein [Oscillospiraceae bacterium]|nr:threonine/serine exporter family protein [Oscillospiraceae bacterium]